MSDRHHAEKRGRWGEWLASNWLRLRGWRIVGRRVKTRRGEIDLIARRFGTVAFVEVKTRGNARSLQRSIDEHRLRRVIAAAEAVAPRFAGPRDAIRIDVMLIRPWALPIHMANVWHG
jgi:putative endonuclease